eukprot:m.27098 g.27098  ORF g.27098 m.27098 type:complete len:584 (-) comp8449_c0_seq2:110-1861(-)
MMAAEAVLAQAEAMLSEVRANLASFKLLQGAVVLQRAEALVRDTLAQRPRQPQTGDCASAADPPRVGGTDDPDETTEAASHATAGEAADKTAEATAEAIAEATADEKCQVMTAGDAAGTASEAAAAVTAPGPDPSVSDGGATTASPPVPDGAEAHSDVGTVPNAAAAVGADTAARHKGDVWQQLEALAHHLLTDEEYCTLRNTLERVALVQQDLSSDEGWTVQSNRDGIRVLYRKEADSAFHTLRLEGLVDASIFDNLAIFYEVDLHHTWMPTYRMLGVKRSERVAQFSLSDMLLRMQISLPWPFTTREAWLRVIGVDCMDAEVVEMAGGHNSGKRRGSSDGEGEEGVMGDSQTAQPPTGADDDGGNEGDGGGAGGGASGGGGGGGAAGQCAAAASGAETAKPSENGFQRKRQVVVLLDSCSEYPGFDIPSQEKDDERGVVRMFMRHSALVLTPLDLNGGDKQSTMVEMVLSMDPSLPVVPSWFINFASHHISHYLLALLRSEVLKVRGSVYEDRIRENREFYGFLEERMAEILREQEKLQQAQDQERGKENEPDQKPSAPGTGKGAERERQDPPTSPRDSQA